MKTPRAGPTATAAAPRRTSGDTSHASRALGRGRVGGRLRSFRPGPGGARRVSGARRPSPSPEPSPSPTPAPRAPFVAGYRNGFTLQSETGDFVLKLTGYLAGRRPLRPRRRRRAWSTDQFLLRRVRPILQGTVARYFDFYIVPDFGMRHRPSSRTPTSTSTSRPSSAFAGGEDEDARSASSGCSRRRAILFVERALPNNLVPNRDVGVQVHGELAQRRLRLPARASSTACPTAASSTSTPTTPRTSPAACSSSPGGPRAARRCAASASASPAPRARPTAPCAPTSRSRRCPSSSYADHGHRQRRPHALVAAGDRSSSGPRRRPRRIRRRPGTRCRRSRRAKPTTTAELDELRLERDRLRLLTGRRRELRQREAQELLRALRRQVGRRAAGRAPQPARRRRGDVHRRVRRSRPAPCARPRPGASA